MTVVIQALSYALMLIFAQNVLFCGGCGIPETVPVAASGKKRRFCLAVAVCSLADTALSFGVLRLASLVTDNDYIAYVCVVFSAALVYIAAMTVLSIAGLRHRYAAYFSSAAFNSAVLIVPFAARALNAGFLGAVLMSLGASAGYALALLIISEGTKRLSSCNVPGAFRGAGIMLLFIGIAAMAFMSVCGYPLNA